MRDNRKLLLTPAAAPHALDRGEWGACRNAWLEVWTQTMRELGTLDAFNPEAWFDNEFVAILLDGAELMGFCLFKEIDLRTADLETDPWFKPWPQSLLDQITSEFRWGLVPSWLTVMPKYRRTRSEGDGRMSDLLCEIMHLVCLDSKNEICFGTPRRDRSIHLAMRSAGAVSLMSQVPHFGVEVDLMAFMPSPDRRHEFSDGATRIWASRIDHLNQKQVPPEREKNDESSI